MKFSRFHCLLILGILSFLVSCGGDDDNKKDDDDDDEPSDVTYYIEFKMDGGELIRFETDEPGYQACGSCACSTIPPVALEGAGIYVCNESADFSTTDIENLENSCWSSPQMISRMLLLVSGWTTLITLRIMPLPKRVRLP